MSDQSSIFIFTTIVFGLLLIYFCIALYSLKESAPTTHRVSENVDKMKVPSNRVYVPPRF